MHDQSSARASAITIDDWYPPKREREDLTVQMQDDNGVWHRRAVGGNYTGCGETINHRLQQELRHEAYDGKICRDGCFSMFELALSEQANRDQKKEDQR